MSTATCHSSPPASMPAAYGNLPARMKVLYITTLHRQGGWLAEALASDCATQILLEEVVGVTAGMARLRDEVFDAILVSHDPGVLDGLDFVEGLRTGGCEDPVLLLGTQTPQEIDAVCHEVGADDYCCVSETTVRGLLWRFARAVERRQLQRENRRLIHAEQQRLRQEHQEAQRLLKQQRLVISDLEALQNGTQEPADPQATTVDGCLASVAANANDAPLNLPEPLVTHYRELLRTYVIMGVGNLGTEMSQLAEMLASAGISAQRALQLHVSVLEELVQGLGVRSARHVMNRADLLVLEVLGHLADGYRQRYFERRNPPRQRWLPGFDVCEVPRLRLAA